MPKSILKAKIYVTRRRRQPQARWQDHVRGDLSIMGVTGWGTKGMGRIVLRRIVEESKAHPGLYRLLVMFIRFGMLDIKFWIHFLRH